MRTTLTIALALLVGCAAGSQLPPSASFRASTAVAADAVCRCWRRDLPQWAGWQNTHDAWLCTVVLPHDQTVPAMPCSLWNTQPAMPTGFDVRVTP